ncbi:MAG TPA: response regulator, partial [Verrucomicrobiota bacterium]|nr:response regulator [Verrucomicrobiota bacterium]
MSTARILIVEDELIVAQDLKNRLNLLGYALAGSASSAATAIAVAEELRPDLVLMDIRLEGNTDGIAAAERIHRDLRVPVVFLTAYSDEGTLYH